MEQYTPNPESVQKRRYLVQVPRKRPTGSNVIKDKKHRVWIKASKYNVGNFAMWEDQPENTYYVWFSRETVPEENEVVFGEWKIQNMFRVERLLRCRVELINI
tara:strand:- start:8093 stop:8401 length:309 start_codon:yes stop_codon:yes gene_type:complete